MSLRIHSVENGNTPQKEKVWLYTSLGINLKGYAVVDRTFTASGQLSNEFRHIFIFPDLYIDKDDWVVLYTCKGQYHKEKMSDRPGYLHYFYWGSNECVWNDNGGDIASLIQYNVVNAVVVPKI